MTDQRSTPIPFLIDLKQTSFASTLDGLSSRAENEDDEGFIMVGPGIQKRKKRRKKKRHKPHNAHEEQAVAPLRSSFDWGSQDMVDNDDGDDDGKDSDDGRSGVAMARDKDASKSCTGECLRAMGADAAVNLGYMKDSLLTKAGWLLTLKRTKADWRAAVTVGLVNLPLSISLAVASGCGPVPGVTTAFWASLITAAFGGCVYNVVGPTGALSGILARNVSLYGVDSLPYLAILTGIVCLIVFLLKWERYVLLVPSSVMEGFTVGVAVIIALNQINFALGLGEIPHHEEFIYNIVESFRHITETDRWSLGLFILSVTSLYMLLMSYQKVPWVIILCTLGIILGYLCSNNYIPFQLQTLQTRYGELEFVLVAWPEFKMSYVTIDFFSSSMSIAFVALLETLISAKIADAMTKTTFNQRKEVFGLGLANIITGAVGGIPATAALARTALNINTGATSRMAGILQSIFVLLLSYFLLGYFNYLPLPIVAAVIVVVAIKMVDYHHIVRFWKLDKTVFCLTFFVAAICVLVEPTSGIVVGMVLAMLMFSDMTSRIHSELVMTDHEGGKKFVSDKHIRVGEIDQSKRERKKQHLQELKSAAASHHDENQEARPRSELNRRKHAIYRISGQLTYINSFSHKRRLLMFRSCDCIIISLRYLYYIDIDGLDALQEVIEQLEQENKLVLLSGVNLSVSALILKADWFLRLVAQGKVFATYMDALDTVEGGENDVEQRKLVNIQNF